MAVTTDYSITMTVKSNGTTVLTSSASGTLSLRSDEYTQTVVDVASGETDLEITFGGVTPVLDLLLVADGPLSVTLNGADTAIPFMVMALFETEITTLHVANAGAADVKLRITIKS